MAKTNVFDADERFKGSMNSKAHQATARRIAEAGAVLLKNDNNTLPLDRTKLTRVAVIGDYATRLQAAGGGAAGLKAFYEITPLAGLLNRLGPTATVTYAQGFRRTENQRRRNGNAPGASQPATQPAFDAAGVRIDPAVAAAATAPATRPDEQLIARAVEAAKAADVAIVVGGIGHGRGNDEEGADRRDLRLPFFQDELIRRVVAANPKTVVVLLGGGPVDMPWLKDVPAVLYNFYGGSEAGNALANLLLGDANPSGKLPFTWPKQLADSPAHALDAFPGVNGVVEYKEGLYVGYRWFDEKKIEPLFPFGYGLSYTSFDCKNLTLTPGTDAAGRPTVEAAIDVTNTGLKPGAEVVQAYVHDGHSSLPRPPQELKGYAKVTLAPGETKRVSIALPPRSFAFWNPAVKGWTAEAGTFDVRVGFGSRDIRQSAVFTLPQTMRGGLSAANTSPQHFAASSGCHVDVRLAVSSPT